MHHRAYSTFQIKSVDEELRHVEGIASTPFVDRGGDVMVSTGAKFSLPMPFRWEHKSTVGEMFSAVVKPDGIHIKATIAKIAEPGELQKIVDLAWQSVKYKLARGLSIGWRPIEAKPNKHGGLDVKTWEWYETSAVSIPMNAHATISMIKSLDDIGLAATGTEDDVPHQSAGVSASRRVVSVMTRQDMKMPKPIADQIKSFEATRQAKAAERDAIMEKSAEDGVTLDAEQTEKYDTLVEEITSIDDHLKRLTALAESNKLAAKAVVGQSKEEGSLSRGALPVITVKDTMPADVAFGAMVLCKAQAYLEMMKGNFVSPLDIAKHRYPTNTSLHQSLMQKTAVAGGTTTDANFASALLAPAQVLESAFLEYLRPMTLVDRFGTTQDGVRIPSLKRVPFNVKINSQTSGASAAWVGEGKGKPVTKFNTTSTTMLFTKIAAISVITEELARFSRPGAEGLVRDELAKAVVERMDTDFIDPTKAVSSGLNPASITNGLTALTSAGATAANVLTDIQALVAPFLRLNYNVDNLVLLMPNTLALTLSLMQNSLGQYSYQGITSRGGRLAGIPVLASNYLASGATYGNMVVCLSADDIALADDGNVTVDASREASIEMIDVSTQDATAGTGSSSVSMFQTNSIAIRAEREINWKKLRSDAVTFMDDVNWGSIGSPY